MNGKEAIERAIDAIRTEMVKIKTPEEGETFGPGLWRALAAVSLGALTGPVLSGATPQDGAGARSCAEAHEAEIRASERRRIVDALRARRTNVGNPSETYLMGIDDSIQIVEEMR